MCNREISEKEHTLWLLAAIAAPVTQTASSCSWPAVAVIGLLCLAISYGMEKFGVQGNPGRWIGAVQWLWMLLVVSEFMHWTMYCWPDHRSYHVVPLVLLLLAAYAAAKGTGTASRAGSALRWPLLFLFGAVLLSGIKEIEVQNLKPVWQMQTAYLITAMLIPVMGVGYGTWKKKGRVLGYAITVSVISSGVLSLALLKRVEAPFYELGRSLNILGVGQRFESLVAAGMTLGYYVLLSYLLGVTAKAWEPEKRRVRSIWISALFTAMVFLSGMRLNSRLLAVGNLVFWVLLPLLKNVSKNLKKVLDK